MLHFILSNCCVVFYSCYLALCSSVLQLFIKILGMLQHAGILILLLLLCPSFYPFSLVSARIFCYLASFTLLALLPCPLSSSVMIYDWVFLLPSIYHLLPSELLTLNYSRCFSTTTQLYLQVYI